MTPTFSGEIQLAGWSESHTGGCKVTFWLQSTEDLEPFRALTVRKGNTAGHRFIAALVEIGDDEQPVQPIPSNSTELEKPKGGALAKLAGMWCNDPEFWAWLETDLDNACHSATGAAACLYAICGIESHAELDNDHVAAEKFHRLIRWPYQKHLIERGGLWRDVR
jgi:hypothetical protein